MEDINHKAEALKLQENMPSREAIMFLEGKHYENGSDYTPDQLQKDIFNLASNLQTL